MEKVKVKMKTPKGEVELSDSDFVMYQALDELAHSIKDLALATRARRG